jgi:hypothetical protein
LQVNDKDIQLLNRLRVQEPDLLQFLMDRRASVYHQMEATANTEELHALRGEARQLSSLISLITEARESSERLEQHRRREVTPAYTGY